MKLLTLFIISLLPFTNIDANPEPFITGNQFKSLCRYSFDEYGYRVNHNVQNNCWFVKTNLLEQFFEKYLPEDDFVLVSHNADHGVTDQFSPYLELPQLIHWYGQNIAISHEKLSAIPIGLCNFSNHAVVRSVQKKNHPKIKLVYANYELKNNVQEREDCLKKTGIPIEPRKPFRQFLQDIAQSYFVISPDGNGIDCHRTWEALYLKAIPIVTRTATTVCFADLPIIIIDSWDDYENLELSPELYSELWGDFDPDSLTVEAFIPEYK